MSEGQDREFLLAEIREIKRLLQDLRDKPVDHGQRRDGLTGFTNFEYVVVALLACITIAIVRG